MSWDSSPLVAEVYDLDKPVGNSFGDVEYYTQHLAGIGGRILEVATGTGRILIPLLEAGLAVEGLDYSPDMLAVCRQHCSDRGLDPVLHLADMAAFVQPGAYEAVIIPAGSVRDLDGRKQVLQMLAGLHDSLAPGGMLLVDLTPPRPSAGSRTLRHWRRGAYLWTLQSVHEQFDPAANRTTRFLRYEKWCDGESVATELHLFRAQHWSLHEFEELMASVGFVEISVIADYNDARRPGPDDDDWTFRAIRP